MQGKVMKRTPTELIVQLEFGTMSFSPGDIVSVEGDAPPQDPSLTVLAPSPQVETAPEPLSPPKAQERRASEMVEPGAVDGPTTGAHPLSLLEATKAVAFIAVRTTKGAVGAGSGTIIGPNGTMLTNFHVVQDAEKIVVLLPGNKPKSRFKDPRTYDATVLRTSPYYDLAILDIHAKTPEYLQFAEDNAIQVGNEVRAIGNPQGLAASVSKGIISAVRTNKEMYLDFFQIPGESMSEREFEQMTWIQTDAAVNPGNSGGPLLDRNNRIVGINSFGVTETGSNTGLNFALHAKHVKKFSRGYAKE